MSINPLEVLKLIPVDVNTIYIGYSGGVDSHVLLHLLANSRLKAKLVAIYVHHGLQRQADDWAIHCAQQCQLLNIPVLTVHVDAHARSGQSPEEAARLARYEAFKHILQLDDCLVLAQHEDDQAETFLLQAFRGAGLAGLAAMPLVADFGRGKVIRPLLDYSRAKILDYAKCFELSWIEDPSNQESEFDRNFLRNEVLPVLRQRWPQLTKTLARSASHCGESLSLVDKQALHWLANVQCDDHSLSIEAILQLESTQQRWVIRKWLQSYGLRLPSQAIIASIVMQFIHARQNANPIMTMQDYVLRRFQARLYCLPKEVGAPGLWNGFVWEQGRTAVELMANVRLGLKSADTGIPRDLWRDSVVTVCPRVGGEGLRLPNRIGTHSLKKLYQEYAVPPWERDLRPLIYLNGQLAAVAGLWVDQSVWGEGDCLQIDWFVQNKLSVDV